MDNQYIDFSSILFTYIDFYYYFTTINFTIIDFPHQLYSLMKKVTKNNIDEIITIVGPVAVPR